jgi:hypothetical protein
MGRYINRVGDKDCPVVAKVAFLVANAKAEIIERPTKFVPNLVCVVENDSFARFDAAAYAYSPAEMHEFSRSEDHRPKTWLIVPDVDKLAL